MKNLILIATIILGTSFASVAQKYGYIDSDYILSNLDEYNEAKEQLNKMVDRWTQEIDDRYAIIKEKKDNFAKEEVLLPTEEREKRQEEIKKLETEAMELQKTRFGVSGDYFQKRQELIKPIQDKIFEAMQKVASKKNYSFIFDKANQSNLIYADPKYDLSDAVIKELGIHVSGNNNNNKK